MSKETPCILRIEDALETAFLSQYIAKRLAESDTLKSRLGLSLSTEDGKSLDWTSFTERYLIPNRPVLIRGIGDDWEASKSLIKDRPYSSEEWLSCDLEAQGLVDALYQRMLNILDLHSELKQDESKKDERSKLKKECLKVVLEYRTKSPNFENIKNTFGKARVSVVNCLQSEYNSQTRTDTTLEEYLEDWKASQPWLFEGYHPGSSQTQYENQTEIQQQKDTKWRYCKYLRDWHVTRDFPKVDLYRVPQVFANDWIDEYFAYEEGHVQQVKARKQGKEEHEADTNDYRFLYMGPGTSFTPLHRDVFGSYSWSTNLCGAKLWLFYPPDVAENTLQKSHNSINSDAFTAITPEALLDTQSRESSEIKLDNASNPLKQAFEARTQQQAALRKAFSKLWNSSNQAVTEEEVLSQDHIPNAPLILVQTVGDAIFVPAMWTHEVFNLSPTISLNHNWTNACGLNFLARQLKIDHLAVQRELMEFGTLTKPNLVYWSAHEEFIHEIPQEPPSEIDRRAQMYLFKAFNEAEEVQMNLGNISSTLIKQMDEDAFDLVCASENMLRASAGIDHGRMTKLLLYQLFSCLWRFASFSADQSSILEEVGFDALSDPLKLFVMHLRDVYPKFSSKDHSHLDAHNPHLSHFHYEAKQESLEESQCRQSILFMNVHALLRALPSLLLSKHVTSAHNEDVNEDVAAKAGSEQQMHVGDWISQTGQSQVFHAESDPSIPLPNTERDREAIVDLCANLCSIIALKLISTFKMSHGCNNGSKAALDIEKAAHLICAWFEYRETDSYFTLSI